MLKTRDELCNLINNLNLKQGVEIGVARGIFHEILLTHSNLEVLWGVDPWHKDNKRHNMVVKKLKPFGNKSQLIRNTSLEASKQFTNDSLDFIYIDAMHDYKSVKQDIELWWPKLRMGGVFSGHDYYVAPIRPFGVIEAVDEFEKQQLQEIFVTGCNSSDKLQRHKLTTPDYTTPGTDRICSWWCIKQ